MQLGGEGAPIRINTVFVRNSTDTESREIVMMSRGRRLVIVLNFYAGVQSQEGRDVGQCLSKS